ncbi:oxidoreductase [Azotobacter salinestris]
MSILFEPYDLGPLRLRNRIVMAPMTRVRNPDGIPNALNVLYHSQRASAGLIVTAGTPISRRRRALCSSPASIPRRRSPAGRGKRYNCDLNASYNIAVPYWAWKLKLTRRKDGQLPEDRSSLGKPGMPVTSMRSMMRGAFTGNRVQPAQAG